MARIDFSTVLLVVLLFIQVGCWAAVTKRPLKGNPSGNVEDLLKKNIRSASPAQLNKYKTDAAKRLQSDLSRALQAISTNTKTVPLNVRNSAKSALKAVRAGKVSTSLMKGLPTIMQKGALYKNKPAQQLQVILASVIPNAPADARNPLQGVLDFVSTNLVGVNTLLGRVLGGTNDLLSGVVTSLSGSLGAVTDAVNGSVGSLGTLLGGLLAG